MASFDYRLNPLYAIKECSSCGALYTTDYCCSKGGLVDKIICDLNKTPDSSQRPPPSCAKCGNPVDGPYCRGCALLRKKFKEDLFTYCVENGIFQDLQYTSESSNENTNVVNAPQEPFVVKQDPGSHIGYNCPLKVPIISNPEPCNNQTIDEFPQTLPSFDLTCYSEKGNSLPYVSKPNFVDDSPNVFNPPPQPLTYSYEFYGNDARYGHYCTPQVPFIYPEPCYNQDFNFPQYFHNFQQQYLRCENCGGPHETYECQPLNEDYYHEQNSCYDSNSFGFDQFQPPQYTVNHPIFNAQNELFNSQNKLVEQLTSLYDMIGQYIQKKEEEKRIEEEQAAKARCWKILVCYDDDDDEESSIPLKDIIIYGLPPVKNLVQNPSESEDASDGVCDLPICDDFPKSRLVSFSNPLFDISDDCTSSDDESFSEEDVPMENFKFFSNPLFDLDEEIVSTEVNLIQNEVLESITSIPSGIDSFDVNAESDLLESLLQQDTSINDSQKIDSLLDEFAGELTLLHSIPPGIDDVNLDPEGDILFLESLLYDNSSPRPPEEFNSENPTESFSPSPIPIQHDVVEDIPVDVPNILPTHPALQLDFDFIPSHNDLGSDLDNSSPSGDRNKIYDPGICIEVESTRFLAPLSPVIDTLLPFSSENEDKVFNHGVLAYKEKSPPSSSHRGLKALQLSPESPMLIHGDNTPNLGVRHLHFYPP
ncbi:hypothetical protein Tco_0404690 [Tanacetum coccineum]